MTATEASSPPTTPKPPAVGSHVTPPRSKTIYEPVGGDAIKLGRSNPLSVGVGAGMRRERSFEGSLEEEDEGEGVQIVQIGRAASRMSSKEDKLQDVSSNLAL